MIKNTLYRLKKEAVVGTGMSLPAKQEIHIVMDCVYVNGFPVDPLAQTLFYNWIKNNLELFEIITNN